MEKLEYPKYHLHTNVNRDIYETFKKIVKMEGLTIVSAFNQIMADYIRNKAQGKDSVNYNIQVDKNCFTKKEEQINTGL